MAKLGIAGAADNPAIRYAGMASSFGAGIATIAMVATDSGTTAARYLLRQSTTREWATTDRRAPPSLV